MNNNNLTIEGATLKFRNFEGKEGQYNPAGRRNFSVLLDTETAERLLEDGWNVRYLQPKEEGDDPQAVLSVAVRFDNIPPKIVLINGGRKSVLGEEEVKILDWAEIETVDLIIKPSRWAVNGKSGIKAYLKTMYVTTAVDQFEEKYYDAPDSAAASVGGCGNCEECTGECKCHAH